MPYFPLTKAQQEWLERAEALAADVWPPTRPRRTAPDLPEALQLAARGQGFLGLRADPATAAPVRGCSRRAW